MAGLPATPVTQQAGRARGRGPRREAGEVREAARCLVVDAGGRSLPFEALYGEQKAIVVFVRVRRELLSGKVGRPWEGRGKGSGDLPKAELGRRGKTTQSQQVLLLGTRFLGQNATVFAGKEIILVPCV